MSAFRPYGDDRIRVVSDLSRFEHEALTPRNRSRNTTPTSLDESSSHLTMESIIPPFSSKVNKEPDNSNKKSLLEIAEEFATIDNPKRRGDRNEDMRSEIYNYYMKPSVSTMHVRDRIDSGSREPLHGGTGIPYAEHELALPPLPNEKDINRSNDTLIRSSNELPPMTQPKDLEGMKGNSLYGSARSDVRSVTSKQKELESRLIKNVMNQPFFSIQLGDFKGFEDFGDREVIISRHFVLYLFEIIFEIIIISLSSVLLGQDHDISKGIYRYFIASASISLTVSLLFVTTLINFEKRNGSFYCLLAFVLNLVAFIMMMSNVIVNSDCRRESSCRLRKAVSAFIIMTLFMWLANIVMFLTTLYISRLNLLGDINFEYSSKGAEFRSSDPSIRANYNQTENDLIDPQSGQPLKEYVLNQEGEMWEVNDSFDMRGKNKIIVYTL